MKDEIGNWNEKMKLEYRQKVGSYAIYTISRKIYIYVLYIFFKAVVITMCDIFQSY